MGQYNKAVLTAAGENLIARTLAGEIQLNITKAKTSNYIYPASTDFKSLTDMQGIKQTATDPVTAVYNDTMIQTRVLFSNEEIAATYYIHNIGLYAMDGTQEVLFCIVTAETPDEMPQYNGVASTSYIYNIQNVVQDAAQLNITVNPSGTATIQDVLERVDSTGGDISETVIETLDTVEDKYPVPAAGESVKRFFGKVLTFLRNIRPLTGDITLYVAMTGSDVTGDGTSAKPFKTIQHTIDILPKDLGNCVVIINVADGTYPEIVKIVGFNNGELRLYSSNPELLSDNCKVNQFIVKWNTCLLVVAGFSITTTTNDGIFGDSCTSLHVQFLKITGYALDTKKIGINLYRCIFSVWGCQVSYHEVVLWAYNSRGISNGWATCVNNNYGLFSSYGSTITLLGNQPAANTSYAHDSGGSFIYNDGTQIADMGVSNLSCTWGTISGRYYKIGNAGGMSQVVLNIAVTLTTGLTAHQEYTINGFPIAGASTAITTHTPGLFDYAQLFSSGIRIKPSTNLATGTIYLLSGTYITDDRW